MKLTVNNTPRDPARIASYLEGWLRELVSGAGAKGGVVGISGGVDSSALAALLRRTFGREGTLALIMPCGSMPEDEADARLLATALDIEAVKVDLTPVFDALSASAASLGGLSDIARANIKPRLRMTTLYAAAQSRGFLVFGGSNRDEMEFGYFTKYGDSGVDAMPFTGLLKCEIFALARYLGVPDRIIDKPPSAGLWQGQTDEAEMGVTYAELDRYLATGEASVEAAARIRAAQARSAHKRALPAMPSLSDM